MQKLLTIADVMERYACCRQTASKIIYALPHLEFPRLMVPEKVLEKWELKQLEGRRGSMYHERENQSK